MTGLTRKELRNMKLRIGDTFNMDTTPNVVIKNPDVRFTIGLVLFVVGLLTAIAALFFSFFPEVAGESDIPMRAVAFVNAVISLISNAFGLIVSTPNVPRSAKV